jgi:tyrosyl-tRNA synthetase
LADLVQLASHFTVAEFLAHETFKKRMEEARPLYIHEFIYALMQAYDAHHMKTDVQVGGSDQLFNILAGRKLQQALGELPLIALCTPLLIGTDGVLKMSKSVGNSINMDMTPADMYGKLMSIHDKIMANYYTLLTDVPQEEIDAIAAGDVKPMDAKKRLAYAVVELLHDAATADAAQAEFERVFQRGQQPEEAVGVDWGGLQETAPAADGTKAVQLARLIADHIGVSMSEARRLIRQGAVSVDGSVTKEDTVDVRRGTVIRVGRHRFLRILGSPPPTADS